jgi:hypothetical protein
MIRQALLIVVAMIAGSAHAQSISVNVDGRQVMFQGQGPAMVQGRVLVPLRGVLEAMGAYVEYRSATRSVFARRGATEIELTLGQRAAMVDGSQVMLDVPAMSMGGSTMVPLRFMGESLGADVRWIDATRTVMISSGAGTGGGGGSTAGSGPVSIQAFTHTGNEWIRPGETIHVTLVGTPGMQASFGISGVIERVAMRETASGRYEGAWTAPAGRQIGISGASIIGTLQSTTDTRSIQAATNVSIDTLAPRITQVLPEANAQVIQGDVSVSAVFDDAGGSGVDPNSVRVLVNGQDVTRDATITSAFANLRTNRVVLGRNIAVVSLSDLAGNPVTKTWEFVVAATSTVVRSLTHDATGIVQPGQVINVRLEGAPSGTGTFSIGPNVDLPMSEGPAGVYTGRYTVRQGENLANAPVTAKLLVGGQTFSIEAKNRVSASFDGGALEAPTLTSPTGTTVLSPIKVAGKSVPNAQVKVKVEYETTVLGALRVTGTIFENTLRANSAGNFESSDIELSNPVGGSDTVYKITVVTILESGKESSPRTLTVRRR